MMRLYMFGNVLCRFDNKDGCHVLIVHKYPLPQVFDYFNYGSLSWWGGWKPRNAGMIRWQKKGASEMSMPNNCIWIHFKLKINIKTVWWISQFQTKQIPKYSRFYPPKTAIDTLIYNRMGQGQIRSLWTLSFRM